MQSPQISCPVVMPVAPGLGLYPIALLVTLTLATNIGCALPSANPPNERERDDL